MEFLPLEMDYLTDWMKAKALAELGETDELKKNAVIKLRKLIQEEADLVTQVDDDYLIQILRARKYNVKKSLNLVLNYYQVKRSYKEVYSTLDFAGLQQSLATGLVSFLPYRDNDGSAIMVINFEKWITEERKFSSICHDLTSAAVLALEDPATQVCGIKLIVDLKVIAISHIKHVHPRYLILIGKGVKNGLPLRLKAMHMVNENSVFSYFWSVLSLALTEKIKNRVFFHSTDLKSLHKHLSPELLPKEYGGNLPLVNASFLKKIGTMENIYSEKMAQGYTSKKLNEKSKTTS